jgi:parvulin-like peptidyl-prolyl isomerase
VFLAIGALLGLALAVGEILRPGVGAERPPADAIALVNGRPLSREDYERTLRALATDRRAGLDADDERRVLDRLIEEELLLQNGEELGLLRRDARVRGDLVAAVIDTITAGSAAREPTAAELAAFYAENGDRFAMPGRARIGQLLVAVRPGDSDDAARTRAERAAARLRSGEDFAVVAAELGDAPIAPVPDTLLPPAKLREYLGPTAARVALALDAGEVSDPVRSSQGYNVLVSRERDISTVPPLDEVREQVRAEWQRRSAERALREYLDELRARAHIVTGESG